MRVFYHVISAGFEIRKKRAQGDSLVRNIVRPIIDNDVHVSYFLHYMFEKISISLTPNEDMEAEETESSFSRIDINAQNSSISEVFLPHPERNTATTQANLQYFNRFMPYFFKIGFIKIGKVVLFRTLVGTVISSKSIQ